MTQSTDRIRARRPAEILRAALVVAALGSACDAFAKEESDSKTNESFVYVQVRQTAILSKPQYFSAVKSKVNHGAPLEAIGNEGSWVKVRGPGKTEGYVHISALSSRRVEASADKNFEGGASQSDISLAGKGFSAAVEKSLSAQDGSLNFAAVNQVERITVPGSEVSAFITSGKLTPRG